MDLYEVVVKDASGRIYSTGMATERDVQDRVSSDVRHAVNLHRNAQGVIETRPSLVITITPVE